jgi:hypothetical protein
MQIRRVVDGPREVEALIHPENFAGVGPAIDDFFASETWPEKSESCSGAGVSLWSSGWRWWWRKGRDLFGDGEAGAAKQLKDDSAAEAGGIVFHQNRSICLVEAHSTNPVNIVKLRDRAHGVFCRMLSVEKADVDVCGHASIINRSGGFGALRLATGNDPSQ